MNTTDPIDFSDLEELNDDGTLAVETTSGRGPHAKNVKFPCQSCAGTGVYQGARVHQVETRCFACRGKGHFLTSEADRAKNRAQSKAKKACNLHREHKAFEDAHPGLIEFLSGAEWSSFAQSLVEGWRKYGRLTDSQTVAAERMRAKAKATRARKAIERAAERAKEATDAPTLPRLAETFLAASRDLNRPKLRLVSGANEKIVITRATAKSRTPGWLMVSDGGPYGASTFYGRISPEGIASLKATPSIMATLRAFNIDPNAEAKVQGQRTGNCMCCGRELTDPGSVAAGIGPICGARWAIAG